MDVKEQLLDLKPYQPGKPIEEVKKEYGLSKIIKLASNENPYGCSEDVKAEIKKSIDSLALYPDGSSYDLRSVLAMHLGVDKHQLIFGNGSDEVISLIAKALLYPGKNTVMATPTFSQYKHNAIIEGAEIREITLINGHHDLEGMLKAIDENTQVVWVCSPNNPTGCYVGASSLTSFIDSVPKHVLVVVDEAYYEYVTEEDFPNSVQLLEKYPNVMILRTFSKAYGLASLRIGYGIGNSEFIKKIEPARGPFNTNRLAQIAAIAAIGDQKFISTCIEKNKKGLSQFYQFCEQFNLSYYQSQGNFILIDFKKEGNEVFQYLLERGIIVRSGNALGFPTSVRITVGSEEQNIEIINILTEMLKNEVVNI
ncbi:histidinol-phosphate transaminase [Fredinandcohnia quinoae]|uniref:Histidinol-phosphate aminotransferase n=1 Tax=Fredinandcohnia quinoae TaxID=2918902 RepID=A0AAW5E0D6_9BACI|nr:histidinol-phosphate transaminase [Fredinandcohnia sp. SECRCQ15]MCH1624740.1 histidinol-phosphate transaminase [Fredinandcohnia sp. SECRCQ15]